MGYAEVSVNSPIAQRQTFSYAIPPGLDIKAGQAVWVPFGDKTLQGIVLALSDYPAVAETREITSIIEPHPVLSPTRISLACWISQRYLSPLFNAVALMLPPGFERQPITFITAPDLPDDFDFSSLTTEQRKALALIKKEVRVNLKRLEKALGKKKAQAAISQLTKRGLVVRSYEIEPLKAKPKEETHLKLLATAEKIEAELGKLRQKGAKKQAALLHFLLPQTRPVPLARARQESGCDRATARTLADKGLISLEQVTVRRNPLYPPVTNLSYPLPLTGAQKAAFRAISDSLHRDLKTPTSPDIFLLHGVTGSGKTEVYLQALAETVKLGKRGIALVPEISLTPQTIERFASRFPDRVAVLHSQLTLGEQFDEWQRVRNGEADVVIGPRSAIFAPQPDLGLIIIDEEHEWAYKQQSPAPRYHARNVAIRLAELSGAVVILGSATPDVETFHHAQQGEYQKLRLPERVTPRESTPLPEVEIVDLKAELKAGNRSLFSRSLYRAITRALAQKEQVILFLNRRGAATFIQCRNCGFVLRCRRCQVPLTYHLDEDMLACHQCNHRTAVPRLCPRCHSPRIKFLGAGTQKLEQEVRKTFPRARLLRWDSDITTQRHAHQEILSKFRSQEADILIGTQIIVKGLDLPEVTLVGVISADTALNLPDFRTGERTFQLLSQVAGRTGRGTRGGRAIIQTYTPEHYAIQAAAKHDYTLLYNQEIAYRHQLQNPPFSHLASLVYTHTNDSRCQREAESLRRFLAKHMAEQGIAGISIIGPAPAFIHRRRGRFRWQLFLRGTDPGAFLSPVPLPRGWTVDIDPIGL